MLNLVLHKSTSYMRRGKQRKAKTTNLLLTLQTWYMRRIRLNRAFKFCSLTQQTAKLEEENLQQSLPTTGRSYPLREHVPAFM